MADSEQMTDYYLLEYYPFQIARQPPEINLEVDDAAAFAMRPPILHLAQIGIALVQVDVARSQIPRRNLDALLRRGGCEVPWSLTGDTIIYFTPNYMLIRIFATLEVVDRVCLPLMVDDEIVYSAKRKRETFSTRVAD